MEKNILTAEELQSLKQLREENLLLINQLGDLEFNYLIEKEKLIEKVKEVDIKNTSLSKSIKNKYGEGYINIETGEVTKE